MGILRDYWADRKKKDRELDRILSQRFEYERLPKEAFTEFKKRYKKNPF